MPRRCSSLAQPHARKRGCSADRVSASIRIFGWLGGATDDLRCDNFVTAPAQPLSQVCNERIVIWEDRDEFVLALRIEHVRISTPEDPLRCVETAADIGGYGENPSPLDDSRRRRIGRLLEPPYNRAPLRRRHPAIVAPDDQIDLLKQCEASVFVRVSHLSFRRGVETSAALCDLPQHRVWQRAPNEGVQAEQELKVAFERGHPVSEIFSYLRIISHS
jgi:hypothetical protein